MALGWGGVTLLKDGEIGFTSRSGDLNSPNPVPFTDIAGSPTQLWGMTFTESEVEHANFGAKIRMSAPEIGSEFNNYDLNAVRIKVYYTVAAGGFTGQGTLGITPLSGLIAAMAAGLVAQGSLGAAAVMGFAGLVCNQLLLPDAIANMSGLTGVVGDVTADDGDWVESV